MKNTDYSFLRLKPSLTDALCIGDPSVTTHVYHSGIQLLPNKTYTQITNVEGGINLTSDIEAFVIDCDGNTLADITDHVFVNSFVDVNGRPQAAIEYVNLGVDFYRQTVLIKINFLLLNRQYYTNPINITAYEAEKTVFFKYKNTDDFMGVGYTNANMWQSISLAMYFDIPVDESEVSDYFQISKNNIISARALIKHLEQYQIEKINRFTFERLNILLKHELIYIDDVRVTNKPVVSSSERFGDSNYFETNVIIDKNYNDCSPYAFQIFDGLELFNFNPYGNYALSGYLLFLSALSFQTDYQLTINTGTITVYDSNNTLIGTVNESAMSTPGGGYYLRANASNILNNLSIGSYYVHVSAGLVSALGVGNEAIADSSTWTFTIREGDFNSNDFNNNDFFTT